MNNFLLCGCNRVNSRTGKIIFRSEVTVMSDNKWEKQATGIIKDLSIEEKAKLLSQIVWETTDIEKTHPVLNKFLLADGPAGIRRLKEYFDEDIYNTRPATCYPSPSTYASSWNRRMLFCLGQHMGREARQEGVDTLLAPAVNIKRTPLGGRNFEYYSEDPYLTGELAAEFIKGIQAEGVGACLKHFAANNQETRRMNICVEMDEEALHEVYLSAFEKPVKEGRPKMIMAAYNKINGEYCASNPRLLDLLRKDWGYEGVVVTDCYAAHHLAKGLKHGLTLQMPGECEERIVQQVTELIEQGELTEQELDKAVLCNLRFALEAAAGRTPGYEYDREAHHTFARELAEESMVLLKNENNALPLKKEERILIVGEFAVSPRFQGGGSSHVHPWRLEIPLDEIRKINGSADYLAGYLLAKPGEPEDLLQKETKTKENHKRRDQVLAAAEAYDKIVVFVGLPDLAESEGYDRASLELPEEQNQLIFDLIQKNLPIIVVLSNGSPVELPWRDGVAAILESYLGGESGGSAIAEILYGQINPSGKLAETFPVSLKDHPSYLYFPGSRERVVYGEGRFVGYKYFDALNKPAAFPFGHGLSYTEFSYTQADSNLIDLKNNLVRVKVQNTGTRAGKEIIQVYVQQKSHCDSVQPKKLAGFEKIHLSSGESQEISIFLDPKAFMRYHADSRQWQPESGAYEITVGSSIQDIRLRETAELQEILLDIGKEHNIGDLIRIEGMYKKLEKAFKNHPVSLRFLEMTKEADPLKAISMGSLMTLETLKRTDPTMTEQEIAHILQMLE